MRKERVQNAKTKTSPVAETIPEKFSTYNHPDPVSNQELYREWLLWLLEENRVCNSFETKGARDTKLSFAEEIRVRFFKSSIKGVMTGHTTACTCGVSKVLELYEQTASQDKIFLIEALCRILDDPNSNPAIKANIISTFASSAYQIVELHGNILKLAEKSKDLDTELIYSIIAYFLSRKKNKAKRFE